MADEIDLEKCNFQNFRSSVTSTLTLDRVEVKLRISGQGLSTHQIRLKSEKLFVDGRKYVCMYGQTDRAEFSKSIRTSPRRWPKNQKTNKNLNKRLKEKKPMYISLFYIMDCYHSACVP